MSDKEKDYFVPEQLDDVDFEKEKTEAKRLKKERRLNKTISDDEGNNQVTVDKNKIKNIIFIILAIGLIAFGIYFYLNPIEKKASEPEQVAKDFCTYFNGGNWKEVKNIIDFKGFYTLSYSIGTESEFTKYDKVYKDVEEEADYSSYSETMDILTSVDNDTLDEVVSTQLQQIRLTQIQSCNKIQGTDSLYRIIANYEYIVNGAAEAYSGAIYVSNASGEYKIVYGDWVSLMLNIYYSIYSFQSAYGY